MVNGRLTMRVFKAVLFSAGIAFASVASADQDPTAPLGWMKPKTVKAPTKNVVRYSLPELQSIICDKEECSAILNNQVVSKGDTIRGYRINKIDSETVRVQRSGKLWTLSLFSNDIKK